MSTNLLPVSIQTATNSVRIFGGNGPDRSVMNEKLKKNVPNFNQTPSYIYLYVIGFGNDGQLQVTQTLYHEAGDAIDTPKLRTPIPFSAVPSRVESIMNANLPQNAKTASFGRNFQNDTGHWDRVSYLAFVIDHTNWRFCDDKGGSPPPAVFTEKGQNGKNHTFYDGEISTIGNGINARSLFYCVNHARNKKQAKLGQGEREDFKYDLYTKFSFGNGADDIILIFDPGGTNLGPPKDP
jgi:hypothetical protein